MRYHTLKIKKIPVYSTDGDFDSKTNSMKEQTKLGKQNGASEEIWGAF